MILNRSTGYWTTGIVVRWSAHSGAIDGVPHSGWAAKLDYFDDGFTDDDPDAGQVSTEGTLRTRYAVRDGDRVGGLRAAVDTLVADAQRLGIRLGGPTIGPCLYYQGDGEDPDWPPPPGWEEPLAAEADRLGWDGPAVPLTAAVTVDDQGRLTADSTVTVGDQTWQVPERTEQAGIAAPVRIGVALRDHGYRMIRDAEHDQTTPGVVRIPIEPDRPADTEQERRR